MAVSTAARLAPTPASIRADLLTIGCLALPVAALGYLALAAPHADAMLVDARLHGALVWSTAAVSALLGLVALRAHAQRGDSVTLALGWGLLVQSAVGVWAGVFDPGPDAFAYLVFRPLAGTLFAIALLLIPWKAQLDATERRRNVVLAGLGSAVVLVSFGVLGEAAEAYAAARDAQAAVSLRITLWFVTAFVTATAGILVVVSGTELGRTASVLLPIGIGLLTEQALFMILASPWTLLWWAAQVLGTGGLLLVAWTVLVVYQDGEREREIVRLREYDLMKTRLINTAAHELGTPLTPIKVQLHMLRSQTFGPLNEKQKRSVDVLDRNISQLAALVQDVLDAARLQANRVLVAKQPTDLVTLVDDAVEAFRPAAAQKHIALEAGGERSVRIDADPKRVTQVVFNLLNNALKFTPSGGHIRVEVSATADQATVVVRDDGIGMNREDVDRLFQPFSQVHDAREHTTLGSGLGLYICRGIVEQHGGVIGCVETAPGKGTAFAFTLPRGPRAGARREGAALQ